MFVLRACACQQWEGSGTISPPNNFLDSFLQSGKPSILMALIFIPFCCSLQCCLFVMVSGSGAASGAATGEALQYAVRPARLPAHRRAIDIAVAGHHQSALHRDKCCILCRCAMSLNQCGVAADLEVSHVTDVRCSIWFMICITRQSPLCEAKQCPPNEQQCFKGGHCLQLKTLVTGNWQESPCGSDMLLCNHILHLYCTKHKIRTVLFAVA